MFAIVVNEKGGEQKRLEFDKPEVTIGRVQGNDIILPKGNVSKRHSRIVLKDGKFIIVDLKSTNGTYVNGRKITSPLVVKGSDKIYIGDFILSIEEVAGQSALDEPGRGRQSTIPPPPPAPSARNRPATLADGDLDDGDSVGGSDEREEPSGASELPPEPVAPRAVRPSQLPTNQQQPAPLPPPAPAPTRSTSTSTAAMAATMQPRPVSRTDLPAVGARPEEAAPAPRPAPRPAPTRPQTTQRPTVSQPAIAPPVSIAPPVRRAAHLGAPGEDQKRQPITDVMRELSSRLLSSLDLTTRGPEFAPDEDMWKRAESTAGQLIDQLFSDGLPAGVEAESLGKDVVREMLGAGPLEELFADESVREIAVPRHDRIFVERQGTLELSPKWFSSPDAVERVLARLLQKAGRRQDLDAARSNGMLVEARLDNGLLVTAALPPMAARGPALTFRRPRRDTVALSDLVGQAMLSQPMADFLALAVSRRRNLVVFGPSSSGRSTLLTALARAGAEGERIVSVEEAEELDLGNGPWIALVGGRGEKARDAIHNALRLKPERLVVGDLRGAETLDLIGALAGGLDGAIVGIHAGSAKEALMRLASMARLAPEAPAPETLNEEIARGVQVLIQLTRTAEGDVRVSEVSELSGAGVSPIFKSEGGRFTPTGHLPAWAQ